MSVKSEVWQKKVTFDFPLKRLEAVEREREVSTSFNFFFLIKTSMSLDSQKLTEKNVPLLDPLCQGS